MSETTISSESFGNDVSQSKPLPGFGKSIAWLVLFILLFYAAGAIYGVYMVYADPELIADDASDAELMAALLSPMGFLLTGLLQALLLIPAVLFAAHFSSQSWRETLAFNPVQIRALGVWLLVYGGYFAVMSLVELIAPMDLGEYMEPLAGTRHFGLVVAFVLLAPVIEELIFRGYLFAAWRHTRLGLWGTIILTSVIFTAIHMEQYSGLVLVYVFVLSVILGLAREKTGSIWTPLMLHMVNNLVAVISLVYLGIY